jgi:hypothetical protein
MGKAEWMRVGDTRAGLKKTAQRASEQQKFDAIRSRVLM